MRLPPAVQQPHANTEAALKSKLFDAPMEQLYAHCGSRGDAVAMSKVTEMRAFDNPHMLVNVYKPLYGEFKVHLDENSRGVALWSCARNAARTHDACARVCMYIGALTAGAQHASVRACARSRAYRPILRRPLGQLPAAPHGRQGHVPHVLRV